MKQAADVALVPPLTCATCRHWHKGQRDPMNLGAPVAGQCQAVPPTPIVAMTQQGPTQAGLAYPITAGEFPACGMHETAKPVLAKGL